MLKKTDTVLEIGAGIGILSLLAEPYCKSIQAIEIDHAVAHLGKKAIREHSKGKIKYSVGDIRNFHFAEKFETNTWENATCGAGP